jgi:murein DD-endopeptidase MepM/ murein hydrolase activator NlpD
MNRLFVELMVNNARTVAKRLGLSLLLGGVLLLLAGSAGADRGKQRQSGGATAHAYAIRVVVPGQAGAQLGTVSAPPDHASFGEAFSYPADGSVATTGSLTASAQSSIGAIASASATSQTEGISLFGGEITAEVAGGHAVASTHGKSAGGSLSRSAVTGLAVLGQPASASANGRISLADWGYLTTLEQGLDRSAGPGGAQTFHGFVTALDVHLTAAHNGMPAGTEIQVGYAEVNVQAPAPRRHQPVPPSSKHNKKTPKAPEPKHNKGGGGGASGPTLPIPTGLHPKLTAGGYVFPVYGPVSFVDTFGAFRGDVPGNWHHGDDIFAPLGAPILACADGIVFSVGWNEIGGNRLWLRDAQGNEFYYAHLSAFSPLAKNGLHVKAGEVLGFVGNTGDASGTPTHLHFEIHPASLIFMGYDGAVDPSSYLTAWQHLQDVRFQNVAGWVPALAVSDPAPKPAAILLQVSDISEASGLDPGSLQRAIAPRVPGESDQALLRSLGFRPPANAGSDSG